MSMHHDNLYYPVMYLMKQFMKRQDGGPGGEGSAAGPPKDFIEPIELHRNDKGMLEHVEGWSYVDTHLTYSDRGVLDYVDIKHRLTGKHLKIQLIYNDKLMLQKVIPEILDTGLGEPGEINIPDVIADY